MTKIKLVALGIIICLSIFLRFWQLGVVPPSPDWDEVSLGYNSLSLLTTGRDEFGKFLPTVLRSFDDYKPALYAYLIIPFIVVFDLSVFAVRFPSALFGVLAVIATFFLVKELFKNINLALIASFLLAISPWHIQFSRVAFESNVGDAFNIFALLFFIKGLKKPLFLYFSALFAGLNLYVYQSEKVFTPLFVLLIVIVYRKPLLKINKKHLLGAFLLGLIIVLPMISNTIEDRSVLLRAKGTSIFNYPTELLSRNTERLIEDNNNNDKIGMLLDNRRVVYFKTILEGYLSHFDLNWLYISGDIARHHAPYMGLLYLTTLPFLLIGIYSLTFNHSSFKMEKTTMTMIFAWLLLAPIPASVTTGVPHAVRTLNFLPTFQIFSAIGILTFYRYLERFKKIKYGVFLLLIGISIFNIAYYLNQYFVQYNYFSSQEWQYGYEQATAFVKTNIKNYKKIVVSDKQPLDKSYMFFLFYLKYPPQEYQKVGQFQSGSFVSHHAFDKYEFRPINWTSDSRIQDTLYVGNPDEFPPEVGALKTINSFKGAKIIKIVGT